MTARYSVRISRNARRDLAGIHDYLTLKASPLVADSLLGELLGRIEALEEFPERGSIPREMEVLGVSDYRQLNHAHYRIFYRVVDRLVIVTLIADGRQSMQSLLQRRLINR